MGGSDMNTLLEVDLGSQRLVLRRPQNGAMYTKHQCLDVIHETVKGSKERGPLIDFLSFSKLAQNTTALYKVIQQEERGLAIGDDS